MDVEVRNETGKYYFSMDQACYSCYPHEQEILILQGIIAEVVEVKKESSQEINAKDNPALKKQWKRINEIYPFI